MTPFYKKSVCFACAALTALCLQGCGSKEPVPTTEEIITLPTAPREVAAEETTSPMELVEELTLVMEAGELYTLDHYPNLKSVDLSGSTCYDAILAYTATHPNVDVTYTVSLGSAAVSNKDSAASLSHDQLDYDQLLANLQYLPNLKSLSLPGIHLDAGQISAIVEAYPELDLNYTVELFGSSYDSDTTQLDLTHMGSGDVDEACSRLGLLTNLTDVQLSKSLCMSDVAKLQDANPGATFHYTFSLFGQTLSTTDENVEFKNHSIGDDGETEIRQALSILDNCSRFVLDNCKMSNEVLDKIREDFRDSTNVVWRVYFGKDKRYNSLTDAETIRAVYNVTDDTVGPLRYCEGAKYIDMGHNDYLTDLSFLSYMPNLEVFIGSGCAVKEMPDMSGSKKLTWLELANCYKLTNIDTLESCESLRFLNLSFTKVTNLAALDSLPLERFVYLQPRANAEEQKTFKAIHESCLTVFYGYTNPYGYGWRYDDNGKTYNEYYKNVIREVFNLDYLESLLPKEKK